MVRTASPARLTSRCGARYADRRRGGPWVRMSRPARFGFRVSSGARTIQPFRAPAASLPAGWAKCGLSGRPTQRMKRQDALDYHSQGRPGKIAVVPTKPLANQRDLALAYSPGVAEPCREIQKDEEEAYRYTAKGTLVAVITNGTAVLGLGNIGALAGKPVMEGKGNLFKQFADLDVFDLEVASEDPDDVIRFCQL